MKKLVIKLIQLYQKGVSPQKPACCRFNPTCSQYAIEAVNEWGAFIGLILAFYRILRCNPLCRGGYDPVPQRKNKKG